MAEPLLNQLVESSCKVCLNPISDCVCPECPQCGDTGEVKCYKEHPLKLNTTQLIYRTEKKISEMERELDTEQSYLIFLNEQTEDYCEDWSEI